MLFRQVDRRYFYKKQKSNLYAPRHIKITGAIKDSRAIFCANVVFEIKRLSEIISPWNKAIVSGRKKEFSPINASDKLANAPSSPTAKPTATICIKLLLCVSAFSFLRRLPMPIRIKIIPPWLAIFSFMISLKTKQA